jgi:hypothetical protein
MPVYGDQAIKDSGQLDACSVAHFPRLLHAPAVSLASRESRASRAAA